MTILETCEPVINLGVSSRMPDVKTVGDRVAEVKAKLVGFVAEHQLPFAIVPDLVDLCQDLGKDKTALKNVHMNRMCETYTLSHGVAACVRDELREKLQNGFYSLNIDESTNSGMDKVLNILLRYFDEDDEELRTIHFAARIVNQATSDNVHTAVLEALADSAVKERKVDISPTRMISCLMDNCATMRGIRNGVETQLRKDNPSLLDISGDSVHMVANAAKEVFKPFENYLEDIASDIFYDLEKSPKAKDLFCEIQVLLGREKALQVVRPCPSRFLQMLDVANRLTELQAALRVYYYAFLSEPEQRQFKKIIESIEDKAGVSPEAAARITVIQQTQSKQAKSSTSSLRKDMLLTALFRDFIKFRLIVDLHRGVLEKLQGYTKLLQSDKPIMHKLHVEMFTVVKKVIKQFMHNDVVPSHSIKELMKLKEKLDDHSLQVADRQLCVGEYAFLAFSKALDKKPAPYWATDIAKKLRCGYSNAAKFLLKNLPLSNVTLIRLSCMDPAAVSDRKFVVSFMKLATSLPNVVDEAELGKLDSELRDFTDDEDVKKLASNFTSESHLDKDFWVKVFRLKTGGVQRYPHLSKLVKALLTIFCGPLVEGTFNIMDDIVRADRSKMEPENYEAAALVRSVIKAKYKSATQMPVNRKMASYIKGSRALYHKHLQEKKRRRAAQLKQKMDRAIELLNKKKTRRTIRCVPRPPVSAASSTVTNSATSSLPQPVVNVVSAASSAATPTATSTISSASSSSRSSRLVSTLPIGGKRAALKGTGDLRMYFSKKQRIA